MSRIFFKTMCLALLVPALAFAAIQPNPKTTVRNYPQLNGSEPALAGTQAPVYPEQYPLTDETDLIGDTVTVGMTWMENQHNGTCGRMNTREADGWRQFSWMKGETEGAGIRHIWWNGLDPNGVPVYPGTGVAVESTLRGGYTCMDVFTNGAGIVSYHADIGLPGEFYVVKTSADVLPHVGAFVDFQPPLVSPTLEVDWPRMQVSQNGRLHIIGTEYTSSTAQRQYYISGVYNPTALTVTWDPAWIFVDSTTTIAADVACSSVPGSSKTVFAWTHSRNQGGNQLDNDLYYLIDADGLNPNFNQKVNLTQFIPPNLAYLPDTLLANRDTLRVYTDMGTFIDNNNYAHIAFTTRSYFQLQGETYWNASLIWHWSEQYPDSFRIVGSESYFALNNNVDCGAWNLKAQRPSLGQAANGNLYCMYQVYDTDTLRLNQAGFPSGEIYISISTDGGLNWSQGTNITSTLTPFNAAPGLSQSELTPTMAKKVDTYCHIEYVFDRDAGNVTQAEGAWTNNPVRYHRVPIASIPTQPIVNQTKRLHVAPITQLIVDVTMTPINPPTPYR